MLQFNKNKNKKNIKKRCGTYSFADFFNFQVYNNQSKPLKFRNMLMTFSASIAPISQFTMRVLILLLQKVCVVFSATAWFRRCSSIPLLLNFIKFTLFCVLLRIYIIIIYVLCHSHRQRHRQRRQLLLFAQSKLTHLNS